MIICCMWNVTVQNIKVHIDFRFICDICGAGLKRKEHLERHKLGHNPERPYICSVCCKGKYDGNSCVTL